MQLNSLKLSVALRLRIEGYKVEFNKVLGEHGKRIRVPIFGEDHLGLYRAVFCATKVSQLTRVDNLRTAADAIRSIYEGRCEIVLAVPLNLRDKACEVAPWLGIQTIYAVDGKGRVWVYEDDLSLEIDLLSSDREGDTSEEIEEEDFFNGLRLSLNPARSRSKSDFYLA